MSALPPAISAASDLPDQFIASYGKSGALGVFTATEAIALRRGQKIIIQTPRGIEIGSVLRPASLKQARILGATSSGTLLRAANRDDETRRAELAALEQTIFETSRAWASRDNLPLEVLDVEVLFSAEQAILQFVGQESAVEAFALELGTHFNMTIRLENLASPALPAEEEQHGCDKPDCGRTADGGCSTCSSGGGCSSCGSGKIDMREYFSHLRAKMEEKQRVPLV